MPTMILEKRSLRRLDRDVMRNQISAIASRALGGNRGKVWGLASRITIPEPTGNGSGLVYQVKLKFTRTVAAKSVKLLCLATVNDIALFRRIMDGALASRFSHHIYCPRPSRSVLEQILRREIVRCHGSPTWINPALDWCEEEGTNDPRRAITICLSGRERLLTGEYQKHLRATMAPAGVG